MKKIWKFCAHSLLELVDGFIGRILFKNRLINMKKRMKTFIKVILVAPWSY